MHGRPVLLHPAGYTETFHLIPVQPVTALTVRPGPHGAVTLVVVGYQIYNADSRIFGQCCGKQNTFRPAVRRYCPATAASAADLPQTLRAEPGRGQRAWPSATAGRSISLRCRPRITLRLSQKVNLRGNIGAEAFGHGPIAAKVVVFN